MMLHPEKMPRINWAYCLLKDNWNKQNMKDFEVALKKYTEEFFAEFFKRKGLESVELVAAYGRVVRDWLVEQAGFSYGVLGTDPRFMRTLETERRTWGWMFSSEIMSKENYMTGVFMDHALKVMEMTGNKIYMVSSGLQWQLENTELRKYPTEGLRLPFPCIYVVLPENKYRVYNELTGWHNVEGVYIVEDTEVIPRIWRMIVTGLPNENSPIKNYDDALYHWSIRLPENKTIEYSLQESFDYATQQIAGQKQTKKVIKNGEVTEFQIDNGGCFPQRDHFDLMHKSLVEIFRYVMKVVIYSTLPDHEWIYRDASEEYEALKARAAKLKADSLKKKQKLNARMREIGAHPRKLLGGSIVIDRMTREAFEKGAESGERKQHVRSLVTGHFHHYWTGTKGSQTLVRKWVVPYWKGPEAAPLTQKKHVLKSEGV